MNFLVMKGARFANLSTKNFDIYNKLVSFTEITNLILMALNNDWATTLGQNPRATID